MAVRAGLGRLHVLRIRDCAFPLGGVDKVSGWIRVHALFPGDRGNAPLQSSNHYLRIQSPCQKFRSRKASRSIAL